MKCTNSSRICLNAHSQIILSLDGKRMILKMVLMFKFGSKMLKIFLVQLL